MICDTKLNNIERVGLSRGSSRFLMAAKKPRRTPLTEQQKRDCALLAQKWEEIKGAGRPISQKQLAGVHSVDPSAVSQILRGHIALNTEWKMNFAAYLDLRPQDIWPDWAYSHVTAGRIPSGMEPIVEAWNDMPDEKKLALMTLVLPSGNPRRKS